MALLGLSVYVYRQDRTEFKEKMLALESDIKRGSETLNVYGANIATQQQRIQFLEKQLDAIFSMLREIRDKLDGKQDKAH